MSVPFFSQRGVFVAWGLRNGTFTADQIAARVAGAKMKWITLQDPETDEEVLSLRTACRAHGLYFGISSASPSVDHLDRYRPNFYIANIETPFPAAPFVKAFRAKRPRLPAAVVTNFGGLDTPAQCKPWIDAKFACLTECYVNDNPLATPERMEFEAVRRGWPQASVFPCLGVYHDFPASNYTDILHSPRGPSIYLAEAMTPADWVTVTGWTT